MTLNK